MEQTQLIMLIVGSLSSLVVGWVTKRYTAVPNGLIPLVNGTLASVGFATLGGLGFTYAAVLTGMGAAYAATAAYETAHVVKPSGGAS
jgi:hypothetical protein